MQPNNSGWTIHSIRANAASHPRRTRLVLAAFFVGVFSGSLLTRSALSQSAPDTAERFRRMSEDFEQKGLAEPFKGITTGGNVTPGLFEIRSTGVSTEPVRQAAGKITPLKARATLGIEPASSTNPRGDSKVKLALEGTGGALRMKFNAEAAGDIATLTLPEFRLDGQVAAADGTALTGLLGLDRVVNVRPRPLPRASCELRRPSRARRRGHGLPRPRARARRRAPGRMGR